MAWRSVKAALLWQNDRCTHSPSAEAQLLIPCGQVRRHSPWQMAPAKPSGISQLLSVLWPCQCCHHMCPLSLRVTMIQGKPLPAAAKQLNHETSPRRGWTWLPPYGGEGLAQLPEPPKLTVGCPRGNVLSASSLPLVCLRICRRVPGSAHWGSATLSSLLSPSCSPVILSPQTQISLPTSSH